VRWPTVHQERNINVDDVTAALAAAAECASGRPVAGDEGLGLEMFAGLPVDHCEALTPAPEATAELVVEVES
jgi:hypothetical protein